MSRSLIAVGIIMGAAALGWATSNLNLSKSNIYRLTSPTDLVGPEQAKAMLAELDKLGPLDEAKLKRWLAANFRRFGVAPDRVKKTIVLPAGQAGKEIAVILLSDPADEAQARAATVKSSKSNSSD